MSKYSPLHQFHLDSGAKVADFGGWQMPIEYPAANGGGVLNEHNAVRNTVGLFDVSHLGKASVLGEGAMDYLNSIFTNDLRKISDGQAQYTLLRQRDNGGVIDELIIYRYSSSHFLFIPNAANCQQVLDQISKESPSTLEIKNLHERFALFALQGMKSPDVLKDLGIDLNLEYMSFMESQLDSEALIICRTGYTGEHGYEILTSWANARKIWDLLLEKVKKYSGLPAELGARDTLRTEMGYALHGHELSTDITPVEASVSWAVAFDKEFWGKSVLEKQRAEKKHRRLAAILVNDRGIPRAGMEIKDIDGKKIGYVTSGTFSPSLKSGIALGLFDSQIPLARQVFIDIRGRLSQGVIKRLPFQPSKVK
ncbi:MAG: glycine cleavage system aminomethyltransferase GcvT [Actinomycetota bacterium]